MNKNTVIQVIESSELFKDLPKAEVLLLSNIVRKKDIRANNIFIEEGQLGNEAYIIVFGLAKVYRLTEEGKEVTFGIRGPGEIVGEMALLDNGLRSAHVQAIQNMQVLTISKDAFLRLVHSRPSVALGMLKTLTKRIRESTTLVEDVVTKQVIDRMIKLLHTLAPYFPNQDLTLSHEELAILLGATRPRVTEILHILEKDKKITLSHKKIHIHKNVL